MKKLTTFQIARLLDVSDQSVSNWVDSGQLQATRTPGGHRRVYPDDLVAFLRQHKMEVPSELLPQAPTVLIVEDEEDVARWLAKALSTRCPEFRVLTANDGYTAGQLVLSERPRLVILDLFMPGMDGFEVCRKIKSDPRTLDTIVVAITGHPSPLTTKTILRAGAIDCISKPFEASRICELARELLSCAAR